MSSKASYSCESRGDSVVFNVTPARTSFRFVVVSAVGFVFLAVVLALVVGLVSQSLWGALAGIGAAAAYFWVVEWQNFWAAARHRKAVRLGVGPGTLTAGSQIFSTASIASLDVRSPARVPETAPIVASQSNATFIGSPGAVMMASAAHGISSAAQASQAAAFNVGAALGNGARRVQAERSYTLTVRLAGSSSTSVVAGGLTLDCAEALIQDLTKSIQKLAVAA